MDQLTLNFDVAADERTAHKGTINWTQARIPIEPAESCGWDGALCFLYIASQPEHIAHKRRVFAGLVRETNPKTGAVRFIPPEHRLRSEEQACIIKPYKPDIKEAKSNEDRRGTNKSETQPPPRRAQALVHRSIERS